MKLQISKMIDDALSAEGVPVAGGYVVEHPADISHGDYSTNVAMVYAKLQGKNPLVLAVLLADRMKASLPPEISKIEIAGPGFINFHLSDKFFKESILNINKQDKSFGRGALLAGKKFAIDYADPNPFKEFHIGHLMGTIVGESFATLAEWNGAEVRRFCYQGDVGRHIAVNIWGMRFMDKLMPEDSATISEKIKFLGEAYVAGSQKIKDNPELEPEIQTINKKIYDRSDAEINEVYDKGKEWSLQAFEEIYALLGTKFDHYFFESMTTPIGLKIVKENIPRIFKESEGAIIFPGEEYGLHTRVFITKEGVPTYEAKDVGLAKMKHDLFPFDIGYSQAASEQDNYFKVVIKAISLVLPEIGPKSNHLSHGMLKLVGDKMSSRTGNIITGDSFLKNIIAGAYEKVKDRDLSDDDKKSIAEKVGVGAIKYWVLRQALGKDIIFDKEKALSFEGDSGPYLQYAHTRAVSLLKKAEAEGIIPEVKVLDNSENAENPVLEKMLYRFGEIVEDAYSLKAPHQIVIYLTDLASLFNSYYANTTIVDKTDPLSPGRLALVSAFATVMRNGLQVLSIPVPERM